MSETKRDFFISYNKKDEQWAKWIAGTLEESGYSTIIQAWDFRPGNNIVLEIQSALQECNKIIIVLSKNYLLSEYSQPEWAAIFNTDPTGKKRNLIPVRIANVIPTGLLASIIYVDLFETPQEDAARILLQGIDSKPIPRKKPEISESKTRDTGEERINFGTAYVFVFEINNDNRANPISIKTKNQLRKWYTDGCPATFSVAINDQRIDTLKKHMSEIRMKIEKEEDLSLSEEKLFYNFMKAQKKCEYETSLKTHACTFF